MDTHRTILAELLSRPMSLADLGSATGSSAPTLRRAVHELQNARWIRVVGREVGTGGRPANLFGLDGGVHTLVGVHLAHPGMRIVATDLTGHVLRRDVPSGLYDLDPDGVHAAIVDFTCRFRRDVPGRRITGIGVATPGYVDPATGTVITIGRVPHWNNLPIRARLEDATGLHAVVGNDMDALATREFGFRENGRSYAYVGFGQGVKFTFFLHGHPYVGPFGNAGLVGRRGLTEAYGEDDASLLEVRGLVAAERRLRRDPTSDAAVDLRDPDALRRRFGAVLDGAVAGEPIAAGLVDRMTDRLGAQIAAFVHLVQPGLMVVGGALAGAPQEVLGAVEVATRRRLPTLLDNALIFRNARVVGEDATAIGATRVFLDRLVGPDRDLAVDLAP